MIWFLCNCCICAGWRLKAIYLQGVAVRSKDHQSRSWQICCLVFFSYENPTYSVVPYTLVIIIFLRRIDFRSTSLGWSQHGAGVHLSFLQRLITAPCTEHVAQLVYISQWRESEIYRAQTNPKNGENTVSGTYMSRFGVTQNERLVSRARMM
jgi:hypothetical protein